MVDPDIQAWFAPGLITLQSDIHGFGVFTTLPISRGQRVIRLGGYVLDRAQRFTQMVVPSTSVGISEKAILAELQSENRDVSDFLNHSCDPNLGFLDALTICAVRNIGAGQELTIDYSYWEADESWVLRRQCICGQTTCRKVISGLDWKRTDISKRLQEWASPFIRRRIQADRKDNTCEQS